MVTGSPSAVVGKDEQVGGSLRGAVWTTCVDRRFLCEEKIRPVKWKISVDLISRNLMISLDPVFPAGVHKDGSSNNVGFEEYLRIFDGTIYMAFCRKIDHHVRVFLLKKSIDSFPVCDAFLNKTEIWIVHDRGKGRKIAGIGKAVQADDPVVRVFVEHVKMSWTDEPAPPVTIIFIMIVSSSFQI